MDLQIPTKKEIGEAAATVRRFAHRTPVLTSQSLNRIAGCELFFKCENFQKVGAFKFRGGVNAVMSLSEAERAKGVATHSSGNHAQAIALAAKMAGAKAYIVMPTSAPKVKKQAVLGYGAEVIECPPTLADREKTLAKVVDRTGAAFVHPYNDLRVICGQATAAVELIEEMGNPDVLMAPVGGGGLLSGTALAAHHYAPGAQVVAGEPEGADDAFRSLQAGHIIPSSNPSTIADGLLTSLGDKTFPIIQRFVKEIITVSDEQIVEAMRMIWERMKIIIEPSCAVPFAALLKQKAEFEGKNVGIILTGGNVDLGKLPF